MADESVFTVAGQEFKVTSPERVFYPAIGTTKLDVIGYYVLRTTAASTVMLPHLVGRPATRKRWPEGVDKTSFFVKDLEAGTPGWLTRVQIRHGSGRARRVAHPTSGVGDHLRQSGPVLRARCGVGDRDRGDRDSG